MAKHVQSHPPQAASVASQGVWGLLAVVASLWGCEFAVPSREPARPSREPTAPSREPTRALARGLAEAQDLDPDPNVVHVVLEAGPSTREGFRYAYNGQNPGPLIRAKVGDLLRVTLRNGLGFDTTLHWHGVHAPNEADGVPGVTAPPLGPGREVEVRIPLTHAGTFWYHPHFNTDQQVDGGLYGALVVADPADPAVEQDLVFVLDTEAELDEVADELPVGSPERPAHGHGRLKPRWRVNGEPAPVVLRLAGGTRARVRWVNASNADSAALLGAGRVIGGDQGLLAAPLEAAPLLLVSGDRAESEWLVGGAGLEVLAQPWSLNGGATLGEPTTLVRVEVEQPAPAPDPPAWSFSGEAPTPDPGYTDLLYAFAGDDRVGEWRINGELYPDVTTHEVALGDEVILEVRNLSPTEHPFHLHGMSFEVLSVNGVAPPSKTTADTINLAIRDRVRLRLVADNPGLWVIHCHILHHAEQGMMALLRVR